MRFRWPLRRRIRLWRRWLRGWDLHQDSLARLHSGRDNDLDLAAVGILHEQLLAGGNSRWNDYLK